MSNLREFFYSREHKIIHKWDHYFDIYEEHLSKFNGEIFTMLEIGVFHGGSLQMWADYFPFASIIGADINKECRKLKFDNKRIGVVICDTGSYEQLDMLSKAMTTATTPIKVIIDDGSHKPKDQWRAFDRLFHRLEDGGVYIIEDTHTSYYWHGYGFGNIVKKIAKRVIGGMHRVYKNKPNYYSSHIDSVHYYKGMIVIKKKVYAPIPKVVITGSVDQDDPITNKLV
jgi:hypothetical protein